MMRAPIPIKNKNDPPREFTDLRNLMKVRDLKVLEWLNLAQVNLRTKAKAS